MSDSPWGDSPSTPASGHNPKVGEPANSGTSDWEIGNTAGSARSRSLSPSIQLGGSLWLAGSAMWLLASGWLWLNSTLDRHLAGYLCAGIGSTTCVALYRLKDVEARAGKNYEYRATSMAVAALLIVTAFGLATLHVWPLAGEWSKR